MRDPTTEKTRWVILYCYWLLLFAGTSIPGHWLEGAAPPVGSDKTIHFIGYAILTLLYCRAMSSHTKKRSWSTVLRIIFIVCVYSVFDEWHQQFIPMRNMDIKDIWADGAGTMSGAIVWWVCPALWR